MSDYPEAQAVADALGRSREAIERIDREIVQLLVRRMALGKETGKLKREASLPILDPDREAAVIRRVTDLARGAGLPAEPVRRVFAQIVEMSRRAQEEG